MAELRVHIGHGRAGSSSIQAALAAGREALSRRGLTYLGLMLEDATTERRAAWQVNDGSPKFFQELSSDQASSELYDVLAAELEQLNEGGRGVAIWSNEWILPRAPHVLPALARLREQHKVTVQCYVRRHDSWARSAYVQWGIKHKSYEGPVRGFEDWLEVFGEGEFRFSPLVTPWAQEFGDDFRIFNFDAAGDVVTHFLAVNGIEGVPSEVANASPLPEVLAAQAVFNSMSPREVLPEAFEALTGNVGAPLRLPTLDKLMPSTDELRAIVESRADDLAELNVLLEARGEQPLDAQGDLPEVAHPSTWQLDGFLLQLIFGLATDVRQLKRELVATRAQLGAIEQSRENDAAPTGARPRRGRRR